MLSWRVCLTLFLIYSAGMASESRLPFGTVFKGQDQFNRLVAKAKAENWKSLPIGVGLRQLEKRSSIPAINISLSRSITGSNRLR